ncbi:MAG: tetratricopeptide repeat protein [Chitinivibrionales bacterium]|nr:tetratricopeptide repeat protein [Chitinivibrionales bacterium]
MIFLKNLLKKLNLTDKEIKILTRVLIFSSSGCILFVAAAWLLQFIAIKSSGPEPVGTARTRELLTLYTERSGDLMEVDISAHKQAADNYLKTNRPHKAIPHLLRILPATKNDRNIRYDLATAYLHSGKHPDAQMQFKELLEDDIRDSLQPAIAARLGLVLFYQDQIKESIRQLEETYSHYPHCAEAACYLAQIEASLKSPSDKAERLFLEAIDIDSDYVEARYQQARYFMNLNQYLRCRDSLIKILRIEPLHAKTHSRLGMAYYYLEQAEAAEKSYQTALALNPHDFNTLYNLGELYYTFYNDRQRAAERFKKALAIVPDHAEANFKLGLICLENEQNKEAAFFLKRAKDAEPSNIRILLQLAVAYEKLDMNDKALSAYRSIAGIDALNHIAQQKIKLLSSS